MHEMIDDHLKWKRCEFCLSEPVSTDQHVQDTRIASLGHDIVGMMSCAHSEQCATHALQKHALD